MPPAMTPETLKITVVLLSLAYMLAFEHLGMRRHRISLILVVLSLLAANGFYLASLTAAAEAAMVAFVLLGGHGLWELCRWGISEGRSRMRSHKRSRMPARRLKRTAIPFPLSNAQITARFTELAAKDPLAVVKPSLGFLAWNNGDDYILQLHLIPGGGWVSLFWSPSEFELRDKEIKNACKSAGVPCHKHLLGMRARGLAICTRGQITLAPADQLMHFDEFLHTILAPQEEFTTWLQNYSPKKA